MAVRVTVSASVKVDAGPALALGSVLEPESYAASAVTVESGKKVEVPLLPAEGKVVLLALRARHAAGADKGTAAPVTVTPKNGAETGSSLPVDGVLLAANPGVLAALVKDGPRSVSIENKGGGSVSVDVLACLDMG